jgi:hypothetical protein
MNNSEPFTKTELLKLIAVTTMTQVSKLALKAGNTVEDLAAAGAEAGYTRQGVFSAVRAAGHRFRKERSDKGQTLKLKLNKLIEQANALQAKLAQESSSGTGQ